MSRDKLVRRNFVKWERGNTTNLKISEAENFVVSTMNSEHLELCNELMKCKN